MREILINKMREILMSISWVITNIPNLQSSLTSLPDKPTPPQSCKVTDVYHDNVVVNWTPPADDGGTELTR